MKKGDQRIYFGHRCWIVGVTIPGLLYAVNSDAWPFRTLEIWRWQLKKTGPTWKDDGCKITPEMTQEERNGRFN